MKRNLPMLIALLLAAMLPGEVLAASGKLIIPTIEHAKIDVFRFEKVGGYKLPTPLSEGATIETGDELKIMYKADPYYAFAHNSLSEFTETFTVTDEMFDEYYTTIYDRISIRPYISYLSTAHWDWGNDKSSVRIYNGWTYLLLTMPDSYSKAILSFDCTVSDKKYDFHLNVYVDKGDGSDKSLEISREYINQASEELVLENVTPQTKVRWEICAVSYSTYWELTELNLRVLDGNCFVFPNPMPEAVNFDARLSSTIQGCEVTVKRGDEELAEGALLNIGDKLKVTCKTDAYHLLKNPADEEREITVTEEGIDNRVFNVQPELTQQYTLRIAEYPYGEMKVLAYEFGNYVTNGTNLTLGANSSYDCTMTLTDPRYTFEDGSKTYTQGIHPMSNDMVWVDDHYEYRLRNNKKINRKAGGRIPDTTFDWGYVTIHRGDTELNPGDLVLEGDQLTITTTVTDNRYELTNPTLAVQTLTATAEWMETGWEEEETGFSYNGSWHWIDGKPIYGNLEMFYTLTTVIIDASMSFTASQSNDMKVVFHCYVKNDDWCFDADFKMKDPETDEETMLADGIIGTTQEIICKDVARGTEFVLHGYPTNYNIYSEFYINDIHVYYAQDYIANIPLPDVLLKNPGIDIGGGNGIETLTPDRLTLDNSFNLSGQRVGKDYKGIVIKNGKKTIKK